MTLIEAIKSLKPFKRPHSEEWSCWYLPWTGPFKDLVNCSYFTHDGEFSTSIDLYAEDIAANDYEIQENT